MAVFMGISFLPCYLICIVLLPCYLVIATLSVVSDTWLEIISFTDRRSLAVVCPSCSCPDTAAVKRATPMTISDIPYDILVHIFNIIQRDQKSDTSAVCLGLTCVSFYCVFKIIYPNPMPLTTTSGLGTMSDNIDWAGYGGECWTSITLCDLLRCFMGPSFRQTRVNRKPMYLSIAVYGESRGLAEERLDGRHQDNVCVAYWNPWDQSSHLLFPNPWEFSPDDWYTKSEKIIQGPERELESRGGAKFGNDLDNFVKTHVYMQRQEDRIWQAFREWAEMVKI
ncbi:hypothetical protein DL98DRAFT_659226 [Cadophora sp. DSE1049]|nr:hypothetical protein DL98DRAFT_659226 [Cadophora sp. DSE1049]